MSALSINQKTVLYEIFKTKLGKERKPYLIHNSVARSNNIKEKSSKIYALWTNEEVKAMVNLFDRHITNAPDEEKEKIAYRNKLLLLVGINIGIRASDLCT